MKLSKLVKLSAVGVALLLIPRRSSRQSQRSPDERSPDEQSPDERSPNNSHASNSYANNDKYPILDNKSKSDANADNKGNKK
ncbi:hypothetical protein [Psychrobacter sp.]|uniref:hypothetical protein n=1 Tax=Psychrobacter sp. TaxID=56811 RepID=UPI0025D5D98C|nr:hypothetical protein [Psychrobacter sp.]